MMAIRFRYKNSVAGFTLLELIVVISIAAIILAVSLPTLIETRRNLQARQVARNLASVVREARSRAVAMNRQYMVEILPSANKFSLKQGTQAYNTPNGNWSVVQGYDFPQTSYVLIRNGDCASTNNVYIQANPNGSMMLKTPDLATTVASVIICVKSSSDIERYQVTILRSGLVRMQKT